MGDSMDADLLPELSGETWVAATLLEGHTAGLDLIVASRQDATLTTVREWVQSGGNPIVVGMIGPVPRVVCVGGCSSETCWWT